MFSFFKRKAPVDLEPDASSMSTWGLSEEEQLLDRVGEYTYGKLEAVKVDLKLQRFIWKDGKTLTINQVAQRLHREKPDMPVYLIEDSVMSWLEEAYEPPGITDGDTEERTLLQIEAWLEAHEKKRETSKIS